MPPRKKAAVKDEGADIRGIVIPPIDEKTLVLELEGTAPLVVGRFSEEAKGQMRDKQMKKAVAARAAKDPEALFNAARYILPDGRDGVSAVSFKAAAVEAVRYLPGAGLTQVMARGLFRIIPDGFGDDGYPLVALDSAPPTNWEAFPRNANGNPDIRYRPRFEKWRVSLNISFNAALVTPEQLVNLFQIAGYHVGVGQWRPQSKKSNTGHLGTFQVVHDKMKRR